MKVSGSTSLRNGQQPGYPFIALICWNKYSAAASEGTFFTLPIVVDGSVRFEKPCCDLLNNWNIVHAPLSLQRRC
jgi:hypothetical protein